jgi:hypothetical protein
VWLKDESVMRSTYVAVEATFNNFRGMIKALETHEEKIQKAINELHWESMNELMPLFSDYWNKEMLKPILAKRAAKPKSKAEWVSYTFSQI